MRSPTQGKGDYHGTLSQFSVNTTMAMAVTLITVLHYTIFLQQCYRVVAARHSSGVRRGRFFPVWIPSMHGHRDCNDDDVECQQMSSVRGLDIFIIVILVLGVIGCCFYYSYWRESKRQALPQPLAETSNQYVTMHDTQNSQVNHNGTLFNNNTANQQLRQNQFMVVQGTHVTSQVVELSRQNSQSQTSRIV